jgi:hypothetical protein
MDEEALDPGAGEAGERRIEGRLARRLVDAEADQAIELADGGRLQQEDMGPAEAFVPQPGAGRPGRRRRRIEVEPGVALDRLEAAERRGGRPRRIGEHHRDLSSSLKLYTVEYGEIGRRAFDEAERRAAQRPGGVFHPRDPSRL